MPNKKAATEKPRKPVNGFAIFVQSLKDEKMKAEEDVNSPAFAKYCSEKWESLSEVVKKAFQDKAEGQEKKRKAPQTPDHPPPAKSAKKKKGDGPKKPKTSFIIFCSEWREDFMKKFPDLKLTDISKKLGEKWKSMSDEEKAKYNQMALEERERYNQLTAPVC